jgi:hypothetical protein
VPVTLLRNAGANAISLDASKLSTDRYDAVGEAVDAGVSLWLGVVPATDADIAFDSARDTARRIWTELGFAPRDAAGALVVTPACGLATASAQYVRRVLSVLRDTGNALLDDSA